VQTRAACEILALCGCFFYISGAGSSIFVLALLICVYLMLQLLEFSPECSLPDCFARGSAIHDNGRSDDAGVPQPHSPRVDSESAIRLRCLSSRAVYGARLMSGETML
jgi:hypothetical protein